MTKPVPTREELIAKIDFIRAEIAEILKDPERTRIVGERLDAAIRGSGITLREAAEGFRAIAKVGYRIPEETTGYEIEGE